jgi:peptide/nickel transport system permease protein
MGSNRKTKLGRKMDEIRRKEEAGLLGGKEYSRALNKFTNNRLALLGLILFSVILLTSIFAPFISPYEPGAIDVLNRFASPSTSNILGTDQLGRDIFTRILYGGRISILVGLGSALGAAFIGVLIGSYTGYKGGWIDKIFMRISEIFMAFPRMILVLMLVSILGQSLWNLIIIFILTGWGSVYRMVRSQMLSIREEEYVQALRAFGLNDFIIAYKHMLPNAIAPILVNITLSTAMFILQETSLSFLGLGVPLNISTWGNILNVAQDLNILKDYWWIWLPVGLVISTFVLSINFIGDGLRDSTDPSQQG